MHANHALQALITLALVAGLAGAPRAAAAQQMTPTTVQIALTEQNQSGQSGTATLEAMGGQTRVTIEIASGPEGVNQPAHIHEGTCATLNPAPAFPLSPVQGGKSETVVNVALDTLLAQPYAINVHRSPTEIAVYVACGDLLTSAQGMPTVQVRMHPQYGNILTDPQGRTLYRFTRDQPNVSNCYDQCAQVWPPLTLDSGDPVLPPGVGGTLGVITRRDGSRQVTYNGMPLYYYAPDIAPGDTNGQGIGNVWFVVEVAGS
jgi:predicted lipoprotein with Yx(FWY)xxD motif